MTNNTDRAAVTANILALTDKEIEQTNGAYSHGSCVATWTFLGAVAGAFLGGGGGTLVGGFLGNLYGEEVCK